jgi:prepilin-type N-terminal cleavage/methylation domain-containing protein
MRLRRQNARTAKAARASFSRMQNASPFANPNRGGQAPARSRGGFSLLEMMVSLVVMLIVVAVVLSGLILETNVEGTIANRTETHQNVRNATELLQQEIGQAGRISLPAAVTLSAAVASGTQTASINSSTGLFTGIYLDVDTGANYETVQATAVGTNTFTANFNFAHASGVQVTVSGSFGTGIVPPAASPTSYTNGSTSTVLKLYGDINRDGNVLYVEYTCSPGTTTAPGYLYRNQMSFTAGSKPAVTGSMVLLDNLLPNPNSTPCFQYQTAAGKSGTTYVVDVAVTLTVQTRNEDPQTHALQQETKALLNVSPRNVFESWELDNAGSLTRVQPIPASVTSLLP